jgi:hypothetical protein
MKAVLVIVALVSTLVLGQKDGRVWCAIEPLVTTRAEVEALLGPPTSGTGYILSYDTNDEHITMWFGGAKTDKADPCKWRVEKNTVFVYVVAPKHKLLVSEAKIDRNKFKKEKDPEGDDAFYYHDEVNGTTISTRIRDGEEVVESIHRDPKLIERRKYCPTSNSKKLGD